MIRFHSLSFTVAVLLFGCGEVTVEPQAEPPHEPALPGQPEPPEEPEPRFEFGCPDPKALACTGLYGPDGEHWFSKRPGTGVFPYTPSAELWSDGMHKQRWVWLPPGTAIDGRDPDAWRFPDGSKFWKEFSFDGRRVETRYLEKQDGVWRSTTYRWNDDESLATELREGELRVSGTQDDSYEIPAVTDCGRCHQGAQDFVLGFSAVLLAEGAEGLTHQELRDRGLIEPALPDLQVPGRQLERRALRYLHVNCGAACHNSSNDAEASWTSFFMRLEAGDLQAVEDTLTYRTGVGQPSYIKSPSDGSSLLPLIAPGKPDESAVVHRDVDRSTWLQMPPLSTHQADEAGLDLIRSWIMAL